MTALARGIWPFLARRDKGNETAKRQKTDNPRRPVGFSFPSPASRWKWLKAMNGLKRRISAGELKQHRPIVSQRPTNTRLSQLSRVYLGMERSELPFRKRRGEIPGRSGQPPKPTQ
ncbi:hypothetical protein E2320_013299 [Naja naja]|nr:hypothetical protein E2320_013299 [Naja naja]